MSTILESEFKAGNPRTPLLKPAFRYALIVSAVGIVVSLVFYYTGVDQDSWLYRIVSWSSTIALMVWYTLQYRNKLNNGYMTFGQGVGLNTLVGVFTGIMIAVYTVLFFSVIAPEAIDMIAEKQYDAMMAQGLTETQIEQAMEMSQMFMSPTFFAITVLIAMPIMYCIFGLIISAILKKEEPSMS